MKEIDRIISIEMKKPVLLKIILKKLFRNIDDVFGPELLDPYCKFCFAKKFKMSAMHIQEIVTIAPEVSIDAV